MSLRQQNMLGWILVGLGGLIYLAFRPTTILMFHVAEGMGLMPLIAQWRSWMTIWQPAEFWVYSLPGGLWAAAYILFVYGLLSHQSTPLRLTVASSIPMTGIVSELLQGGHCLPGVFDWADLLCYATPLVVLYIYVIIKNLNIWQVSLTASTVSN